MSADVVRSTGDLALATAAEAAWAQWSLLAPLAAAPGGARPGAIVDPEALVLLSLAVRDEERRLGDVLAAWAREGAWLLSVQRMNSLAAGFPEPVRQRLGEFAAMAAAAGDRRWRRHASTTAPGPPVRAKALGSPRLAEGPALMLRLRAGFGVGVKADLLSFLLGMHGRPMSLRAASEALAYTQQALRTAAEEMSAAGLLQPVRGRPVLYRAEHRGWTEVLGPGLRSGSAAPPDTIPPWRAWAAVFAFLAHASGWAARAEAQGWSPYVASSRARDLVEEMGPALHRAEAGIPDPQGVHGAAYLDVFSEIVLRVRDWTREHL